MELTGLIHKLPKYVKLFLLAFVLTLSFGYFTGVFFIKHTTEFTPQGIHENYNGNEVEVIPEENWVEDEWEEAEQVELNKPLKFKPSEQEIISTIHTHVISFSLIFLALGALLSITSASVRIKKILIIEPFVSIVLTFGGIWLLWKEVYWMKYIVMLSGVIMTIVFSISVFLITKDILKKNTNNKV